MNKFIMVYVADMDKTVRFYQDVLGFTVARAFTPAPGVSITFVKDDAGHEIEFLMDETKEPYRGRGIALGFYVDDINKTAEMLKSKNVQITTGPVVMKSGLQLIYALDINGLELGFFQQPK